MIQSFAKLRDRLALLPRKQCTLLIGIDGCGASGKSTFAQSLVNAGSGFDVVHLDDFYLPSTQRLPELATYEQVGGNFDWRRLQRDLLLPLAGDKAARYQRYDWPSDKLAEWIDVRVGGAVVVEGVYSTRDELRGFYDFRIFVECPREVRLARGIARDGPAARSRWENEWCPAEELYVQSHQPHQHADLIVDGADHIGVAYDREFVPLQFPPQWHVG